MKAPTVANAIMNIYEKDPESTAAARKLADEVSGEQWDVVPGKVSTAVTSFCRMSHLTWLAVVKARRVASLKSAKLL